MTPGQAAYEAFERIWPEESWGPWDIMGDDDDGKPGWEAVAQAAIAAVGLSGPERDLILADLGDMLGVLGLGNYARPESPHEVFRQCITRAAGLRAAVADMLSRFGPSGSGHTARVGQVQIAKWRKAAGLEG